MGVQIGGGEEEALNPSVFFYILSNLSL